MSERGNRFVAAWVGGALLAYMVPWRLPIPWDVVPALVIGLVVAYFVTRGARQ